MQDKGQLLVAVLLLSSVVNAFAQNAGTVSGGAENEDVKLRIMSSAMSPAYSGSSSSSSSGGRSAADTISAAVKMPANPALEQAMLYQSLAAIPSLKRTIYTVPYFVGKRRPFMLSGRSTPLLFSLGYASIPIKRRRAPLFVGRRDSGRFLDGKRGPPMFVGRRDNAAFPFPRSAAPLFGSEGDSGFLLDAQGRALALKVARTLENEASPSEKRRAPLFVGRRGGNGLLDEERGAPLFVGRRQMSAFSSGKRGAPMFVGRRGNDGSLVEDAGALLFTTGDNDGPVVLCRRDKGAYLSVKTGAPVFMDRLENDPFLSVKRGPPMFVGRRENEASQSAKRGAPMFVGRRENDLQSGKRGAPMFVGRRNSDGFFLEDKARRFYICRAENEAFLWEQNGAQRENHAFAVEKRRAPMFVGKREEDSLNELLAALHTLQAARHYRRMIQADKRHNAPFFVDDHQPDLIQPASQEQVHGDPSWTDNPGGSLENEDKRFNEFVGKRADVEQLNDKDDNSVDQQNPYEFLGKRSYEFLGKRNPYEFLGKRSMYEFLGKRSPYEFLGKRSPYEFLGKRSPYEFLGKRNPYEFLGKRSMYEFLGKRGPYEFLGKRNPEKRGMNESRGKRSPYEFLGKRGPYEFLGKRGPYEFLGKRGPYEFLGKRGPYEFLGKRSPYEFLGKRGPYEFLGKRSMYEFLGKRSPYEFLGKRSPYEFLGKRGMYEFLGKRVPYEFLGKRNLYEFLGKREGITNKRVPSKTSTRGMVDFYGKRVQLPYEFVGKRTAGSALNQVSPDAEREKTLLKDLVNTLSTNTEHLQTAEDAFQAKSRTKRYSEWLGKKASPISDQLHHHTLPTSALTGLRSNVNLMFRQDEDFPSAGMTKRYTEFVGK